MPVVIADEASVAALQAMDGNLADIQHQIAEGGHVTGHIAIPVAIASDAAIQVEGSLEHAVTLSQGVQQLNSTLADSTGHELDMSSVQVVSAPQTVVVTSLEAVTGAGQHSETVVVTSLDGVTTTARRTHDGFTIVTVPSQGGALSIGEQEKVQGGEEDDEAQNDGQTATEDDSGSYLDIGCQMSEELYALQAINVDGKLNRLNKEGEAIFRGRKTICVEICIF